MESEERQIEAGATNLRGGSAAATAGASSIMRPHNNSNNNNTTINSNHHHHRDDTIIKASSATKPTGNACCGILPGVSWMDVYFIATWGIFGAVLRIYVGRLFGLDCETAEDDVGDVWHASNICITANGQTERKGGAIFIDLPANILGCFFMGLVSATADHPLPWLPAHHHLQRHSSWHKGLTTGFCGCLTTFASWNTQMVVMLDGTQAELGKQIISALAGYAIGILAAIAAFLGGRRVAKLWRSNRANTKQPQVSFGDQNGLGSPATFDEDDEEQPSQHGRNPVQQQDSSHQVLNRNNNQMILFADTESPSNPDDLASFSAHNKRNSDKYQSSTEREEKIESSQSEHNDCEAVSMEEGEDDDETATPLMMHMGGSILSFATFSIVLLMMLGFVYGDISSSGDYFFYRRMWLTCICTPLGALLRHQLKHGLPSSVHIQWGTWTANVVGAMLSVLLQALAVQYLADFDDSSYVSCLVWALRVGFAGSLSTVSTFVKELVSLERLLNRYLYGIVTLLISMSFGLTIYSSIVRS